MAPTDVVAVICPYCGETVEVVVEADVHGDMVQDCEVCCNPWRMRVRHDATGPQVRLERLED